MNKKTKEVLICICIALVYIMLFKLLGFVAGLFFPEAEGDPNGNIYFGQLIGEIFGIVLGVITTFIFTLNSVCSSASYTRGASAAMLARGLWP